MTAGIIEKDVVLKRINGIQQEIVELKKLGKLSLEEFQNGDGFKLAEYHLHHALEGVFNIASHILSRIPGAQATQYQEIARKMGAYRVVDNVFADTRLVEMAKYRNRIVHFYAEITPDELYRVLQNDLGDFDVFLHGVKNLLEHPEQFGLGVE